jgi:predicted nucleic acid-binding protein
MNPLVVDASALVEVLLSTPRATRFGRILGGSDADLHVPGHCDLEVVSALRSGLFRKWLSVNRANEALQDLLDLPLTRHGHQAFLFRCFELRDTLTAYDASYVALAEGLGAALVTADRRLARAATVLGVPCLPA